MSQSTIERAILTELKKILCNNKLRMKDLYEWSSGPVKAQKDETAIEIRCLDMTWFCCVPTSADKRKKANV